MRYHLVPRWNDMRTKHSWNAVPENWESLGPPPDGTTIDLHVALRPHRDDAVIHALHEVSDPSHPKYGAHLSKEQVAKLVAPHPSTLELVNSWLEHSDVPSPSVSMTHGGSTLMLNGMSVAQANTLLNASYKLYRHVQTNETIVRTVGYALPATLHRHIQTVVPTTCFASPRMQWQTPHKRSGRAEAVPGKSASGESATVPSRRSGNYVTPSSLRWLYSTVAYVPAATDRNVLGIVGYHGDYPSLADLTAFMRTYRIGVGATFSVVQVNGGAFGLSNPHAEANLDIQYAGAMAYPTPLTFYSTGRGPSGTVDWFISWLDYILEQSDIPWTISTSYGYEENGLSREYATRVCDMFARLGLLGVSVLFASGDDGVGRGECRIGNNPVGFVPIFPATCPWVTAVGGTTDDLPEVAASLSGGGFSNYFPTPYYQKQFVPIFLKHLGEKHKGRYNSTGRGVPDIAAQAIGFRYFLNGDLKVTHGTSGSAPIVAGIIALLNDYQISKGRAPLGFLNRLLYGRGLKGLNDITDGSNPGCKTDGFSAVAGWDPVTGLGTPDFVKLQNILDAIHASSNVGTP